MAAEHVDVIVVGAGLSGIGAGFHLQKYCPDHSYLVLERRQRIGGTWDLFRYPGIRSDSDMYTLGYSFRPWTGGKIIADGPSIREYVTETAKEYGIDKHIRFGIKVCKAAWSTETCTWTLDVERDDDGPRQYTCNFCFLCGGYYNHDRGYTPEFKGRERFQGKIVHPQFWTPESDRACEGRRVIVIGSGATAITIVPALTATAKHVTMLQRSPTYMASIPSVDPMNKMLWWLPTSVTWPLLRWRNITVGALIFALLKRYPEFGRRVLLSGVQKELGAEEVKKHFSPHYKPWDQRLCAVPDGDFYAALKRGKASVVTDHIDTFTETGIRLKSGEELEADVIVTATGLELVPFSGIPITIDGVEKDWGAEVGYKGMMCSNLPNCAQSFGYTNASWTLKSDLIALYVCRVLNHMRTVDAQMCCPRVRDGNMKIEDQIDFTSGYIQRYMHLFPKQGDRSPWKLYQNYILDLFLIKYGSVTDSFMEYTSPMRKDGQKLGVKLPVVPRIPAKL